jgi:hypothetical protein
MVRIVVSFFDALLGIRFAKQLVFANESCLRPPVGLEFCTYRDLGD